MTLDELDRLAAEKVMNWRFIPDKHCGGIYHTDQIHPMVDGHDVFQREWQPTRNIAQAFECLDTFAAFQLFRKYPQAEMRYECIIYFRGPTDLETGCIVEAETAPLAIVRACLAARGVKIDNP